MNFTFRFIQAGTAYTTLTEDIPAPYFRKKFFIEKVLSQAELLICGLGFYELFVNGERVTRSLLAPFVSNPDDYMYYDHYDLQPYLREGDNVLGICLGNGFFNNPGGCGWGFHEGRFCGTPRVAMGLKMTFADGTEEVIESDDSFRVAASPIIMDDYRNGEYYDARLEIPGWNTIEFDDSQWEHAIWSTAPRGELRLCEAEPILVEREIKPISVVQTKEGFLYDFGENNAGICRICISGEPGQQISMYFAEQVKDGVLDRKSINPREYPRRQKDIYICKGGEVENYTPMFTYHGFRYVLVEGLKPEQATKELLTYVIFHTMLRERGGFVCGDEIANAIQDMTRRSDLSNFHHIFTDCPQREKNGWTADIALSAEHILLNLEPDSNFREWMRNLCKTQNARGGLPGIVPTTGWGYGLGPAWDCVLVEVPYQLYRYRGDLSTAKECSSYILRYLDYLTGIMNEEGVIASGLGDWCHVGAGGNTLIKAPLKVTSTMVAMDICNKSAILFEAMGREEQKQFAMAIYHRLRSAAREVLINTDTMTVLGDCQTSQAMGLYYGLFEPQEEQMAFERLLDFVHREENHLDVGVLGGRVLFHVLSAFGYGDLAYHMITRTDYPSYGEWVARGMTTLREFFTQDISGSLNHHFWGDVSHWFMECVAGIRYNASLHGNEVDVCPFFIEGLPFAEAWHEAPEGHIRVRWERQKEDTQLLLTVEVPQNINGFICLPKGYVFAGKQITKIEVKSGVYHVISL